MKGLSNVDFYISPENHAATLQYYGLEISQNGVAYRFQQEFINNLFYDANIKDKFISLESSFSPTLESEAEYKALPLLNLLGQELAKNKDYARMDFVAGIISASVPHRWSGRSSSHFIGWWLHCCGHYEQSIPHLEDAILEDLNDISKFVQYSNYLPMDAPEMLHQSYQQLAAAKDWREIYDRLPKPGGRPFLDRVCDKILGSNKSLLHFTLEYIHDRLHNLIIQLVSPKKIAHFHITAANHCLQRYCFRQLASCLQLAIYCLDSEKSIWHCKSCVAGLEYLVVNMPRCIQENILRDLDAITAFEVAIREVARYVSGDVRESEISVFCLNSLSGDDNEELLGYETARKAFVAYFSPFSLGSPGVKGKLASSTERQALDFEQRA